MEKAQNPQPEIADVGVVDVAGDDVAHRVADTSRAQVVGRRADGGEVAPARLEQSRDVVLVERVALAYLRQADLRA